MDPVTKAKLTRLIPWAIVLVPSAIYWAVLRREQAENHLLVDCGAQAARIELDGAPLGQVVAGSNTNFKVPEGRHQLRALDTAGAVLAETPLDATKPGSCALFRVGTHTPLAIFTTAYGDSAKEPPPPTPVADAVLIDLKPLRTGCKIDGRFPKTVSHRADDSSDRITVALLCHVSANGEPGCTDE